ncbi:MAG: helix-turn-helix domain-containing protein [Pseudohongiellaceae bacterium]
MKKSFPDRPQSDQLSIGRLASGSGVKIETIRYYEKIGMMPVPKRSTGGQRIYSQAALNRLHFIRRCRELGFTLKEILLLLTLDATADRSCNEVRDVTLTHLAQIKRKIADLKRMQSVLSKLVVQCDSGSAPACPILEALQPANA